MYEPSNLVLACYFCNNTPHKGTKETINRYNCNYEQCTFTIIHPYYDNQDDCIELKMGFIIGLKDGLSEEKTEKANNTIEIFDLNNGNRRYQRYQEALAQEVNAMFGEDAFKTIFDISTYILRNYVVSIDSLYIIASLL